MEKIKNKNSQLHVRMDQDTMDVLEKKAEDKGLTMSSYIRYLIHRADVEPAVHTGLISDNGTSQTSLKAGSKSVSRKDVLTVEACFASMSECAKGIGAGLRSLKQIVKEL